MKRTLRNAGIVTAIAVAAIASAVALTVPPRVAFSQHAMPGRDHQPMAGHVMPGVSPHGPSIPGRHGTASGPTLPGQDAFGAIQEIVRLLEADPKTEWSKVDLEALRQHLIDMNDVTLKAEPAAKPVDGGLEIAITGSGRTVGAIQRMVPAHAHELNQMNGWTARTEPLPNGVRLTVTSADPGQVEHIRGLGFIGLMVSGAHHQPHHLAMATGRFTHGHN